MKFFNFALCGFVLVLLSCATAPKAPVALQQVVASENDRTFDRVLSVYTESIKRIDAYNAAYFNIEENLDKFGDYPSPAYFERLRALLERTSLELEKISFEGLSENNQVTYQLLKGDLSLSLQDFLYPGEFYDFNQMSNRLLSFLDESNPQLTSFPFDTVAHYEAFLRKMAGLEAYVNWQIQLLRSAVKKKVILPCEIAKVVPGTFQEVIDAPMEKHPFLRPVQNFPPAFSKADKERLSGLYSKAIQDVVIPQYQKFDVFYRTEYIPSCGRRTGFGIGSLSQGKPWYQQSIKRATGLGLTPQMIHAMGLREVARIKSEMTQIQKTLGIPGNFSQFLKAVTTDERFFFKDSASMLQAFRDVQGTIEAKIPQYFSYIPKTPYRVVETSNPEDAAARYMDPTELQPFGRFVLNTKNLQSTPIFGVNTLSLHEAVPGHHFHLAIQFELKDQLPEYRRKLYFSNAFAEGWALYAEFLGREMGLLDDPLQKLGHLSDEMLRAVRLVVDTGIHNLGWSQLKARQYMAAHLASDPKDIQNEVNRYAVWPGQAVGYKVGQLKILELRKLAEKELGPRFEIKQFHQQVVGSGTVSLPVLEERVKKWIRSSH